MFVHPAHGVRQFEPGDRVRLVQLSEKESIVAEIGEVGTVLDYEDRPMAPCESTLLRVRTDAMEKEGFGFITVPPWFVEPAEGSPIQACDDLNGPSG